MVITGYISSGSSEYLMLQPKELSILPESSIRRYREPYFGKRNSQRINLLMQSIVYDLNTIYDKLVSANDYLDNIYPITTITYFDK